MTFANLVDYYRCCSSRGEKVESWCPFLSISQDWETEAEREERAINAMHIPRLVAFLVPVSPSMRLFWGYCAYVSACGSQQNELSLKL